RTGDRVAESRTPQPRAPGHRKRRHRSRGAPPGSSGRQEDRSDPDLGGDGGPDRPSLLRDSPAARGEWERMAINGRDPPPHASSDPPSGVQHPFRHRSVKPPAQHGTSSASQRHLAQALAVRYTNMLQGYRSGFASRTTGVNTRHADQTSSTCAAAQRLSAASIIALPATGQARANSALLPAPIGRIGILPPVPNVLPAPD